MTLHWITKPFAALTLAELYALLQLRSEVFVVEQTCAFQDIDGHDQAALHLLGHTEAGELAAYARLFEAGRSYAQASIGRVVTSPRHRGHGLGRQLLHEALRSAKRSLGRSPSRLGRSSICWRFTKASALCRRARAIWKTVFRTCTWCGRSTPPAAEIQVLLATHYPSKAQTLTSGTEANLRKLLGWQTPAEAIRWADSKATFARNLRTSSGG